MKHLGQVRSQSQEGRSLTRRIWASRCYHFESWPINLFDLPTFRSLLDSFSDDEDFDESDGYFDLSQIEKIINKSEEILSKKEAFPVDSIDGKTGIYDKFDAIRDEIDSGGGSYDSVLVFKNFSFIKNVDSTSFKTKISRRKRS